MNQKFKIKQRKKVKFSNKESNAHKTTKKKKRKKMPQT
jgi:hypothetical protein